MSSPSPSAVGNKFVISYYTQLNQDPSSLRHFYKDNSAFTHGSETSFGTNDETVTGIEEINKKIQNLDFLNCTVTLSVVDCQGSKDGGVFVLVVGHLSNRGEAPKKFVQSFFLSEHNKAYFVLNDVFRFIEDSVKNEDAQAPVTSSSTKEEKERPQPPPQNNPPTTSTHNIEESKPKENKSVPQVSSITQESSAAHPKDQNQTQNQVPSQQNQQQQQPSTHQQQSVDSTKSSAAPPTKPSPVQPSKKESPAKQQSPSAKKATVPPQQLNTPSAVEEKPAVVAQPTGPKTWANMVGGTSSSAPISSPPVQDSHPVKKSTPAQPQQSQANAQKAAPRKDIKGEDKASSPNLFISNAPYSITEDQVKASFSKFGEIKHVNVVQSKGYIFLEYATVEQAQSAIDGGKNGQISIDNRPLSVVESRKDKKQDNKGGFKEQKGNRPPRPDKGREQQRGGGVDRNERVGDRSANGKSNRDQSAKKQ